MKDELVYVEHVLACIGRIETRLTTLKSAMERIRAELIAERPPADQ